MSKRAVRLAFCPTGPGGGTDNSCGRGEMISSGEKAASVSKDAMKESGAIRHKAPGAQGGRGPWHGAAEKAQGAVQAAVRHEKSGNHAKALEFYREAMKQHDTAVRIHENVKSPNQQRAHYNAADSHKAASNLIRKSIKEIETNMRKERISRHDDT